MPTELTCPGCGAQLDVGIDGAGGFRRYQCEGCGAMLCGVGALHKLLAPGVAQHLWTSSMASDSNGGWCPFCNEAMRSCQVDQGNAGACTVCQTIWIDRAALKTLPGAPKAAPASPAMARCENCGAPIESSWDEKCQYCHAALKTPTTVVILPESIVAS